MKMVLTLIILVGLTLTMTACQERKVILLNQGGEQTIYTNNITNNYTTTTQNNITTYITNNITLNITNNITSGETFSAPITKWKNITRNYYNTTTTTPLEITELRTQLQANKEYGINCFFLYQGNLTTIAGELRVNATGTFNHISQALETTTSTTARYQVSSRTSNLASAATATQTVNTPTPYYYNAVLNTTTGGTLYFWWYHETASATTYNQIEKGATCEVEFY
jgi:hypothetical protein